MSQLWQQPSLSQQQTQRLQLSVQMRQSLQVLQLPLQELHDFVQQQLLENPLLELNPPTPAEAEDPFADQQLHTAEDEYWEKREDSYADQTDNSWPEDPTFMFGSYSTRAYQKNQQSLRTLLQEQLYALTLPPAQQQLCLYLIDSLNERGYLDGSIEELAREIDAPAFEMEQALFILQSLEPAGVAARNLTECLLLQLATGPHFNAATVKLVKCGLPLLAQNNMQALAKLLGVSPAQAQQAAAAVRNLTPVPARGYYTGEDEANVIPDALVVKEGEGFRVMMNRRALPNLAINQEYCKLLAGAENKDAREYLKQKEQDANTLIQSVEGRQNTLKNIIECIVQKQPRFFKCGGGLTPLTLQDVAEELGLHVSTVSRAVRGKYVVCSCGTIALKTVFGGGFSASSGEVSGTVVRKMLQKCIEDEDAAKPLSDEALGQKLAAMGIEISRRTVAKYRQQMGYPSASKRKRVVL